MDPSQITDSVLGGWLGQMPRAARQAVVGCARHVTYPAGTQILAEGDRATELGIVETGRIALGLRVPGAGVVTVATVESGDAFALSALVPPHRATTNVVALTQVEALVVDAVALRSAFERDCELAAAVYFAVSRALLRRLNASHEALCDLYAAPVRPLHELERSVALGG